MMVKLPKKRFFGYVAVGHIRASAGIIRDLVWPGMEGRPHKVNEDAVLSAVCAPTFANVRTGH